MLSYMQKDIIRDYNIILLLKKMWNQLKIACGGTSATRLYATMLKFQTYIIDPKHAISNLRLDFVLRA